MKYFQTYEITLGFSVVCNVNHRQLCNDIKYNIFQYFCSWPKFKVDQKFWQAPNSERFMCVVSKTISWNYRHFIIPLYFFYLVSRVSRILNSLSVFNSITTESLAISSSRHIWISIRVISIIDIPTVPNAPMTQIHTGIQRINWQVIGFTHHHISVKKWHSSPRTLK